VTKQDEIVQQSAGQAETPPIAYDNHLTFSFDHPAHITSVI
jgi:hypothetical protein